MSAQPVDSQPLSETESLLMRGIQARERELQKEHIEPFVSDMQKTLRHIEQQHGLPVGSIGTTHVLDADRMIVYAAPADEQAQDMSKNAPDAPGHEETPQEGNDA